MTISAALAEYYASASTDSYIVLVGTLDHPAWPEPQHMISGVDPDPDNPDYRVMMPKEGGGTLSCIPCAFGITPLGHDRDGPTDGRVTIDNVNDLLESHLEAGLGYNEPITVEIRTYLVPPAGLGAVTEPDEVIEGLILREVTFPSMSRAEGTISFIDGREQNVPTGPNAFFTRDEYPGLFG